MMQSNNETSTAAGIEPIPLRITHDNIFIQHVKTFCNLSNYHSLIIQMQFHKQQTAPINKNK
jgi:hypothetical protein